MKILLADNDRTWLRSAARWVTQWGAEAHLATDSAALVAAITAHQHSAYLIAPGLLRAPLVVAAHRRLRTNARGLVWRGTPHPVREPPLGPDFATHLPRPRSARQCGLQLDYLQAATSTGLLDLPLVGEALGFAPLGAEAAVQAFAAESRRLLSRLAEAGVLRDAQRWAGCFHAWRGCASIMGARALASLEPAPAGEFSLAGAEALHARTCELLALAAAAYTPETRGR